MHSNNHLLIAKRLWRQANGDMLVAIFMDYTLDKECNQAELVSRIFSYHNVKNAYPAELTTHEKHNALLLPSNSNITIQSM